MHLCCLLSRCAPAFLDSCHIWGYSRATRRSRRVALPTAIYTLSDPDTGRIRYVGKTCKPGDRLAQHVWQAQHGVRGTHRTHWIAACVRNGRPPIMSVLTEVAGNGDEAERYWIRTLRRNGCALVNATDGGEGGAGRRPSPETRAKMSATHRARWTPEMRAAHKGQSPEVLAKMADACRGKSLSPERRARMADTKRGRTYSTEHRAAISASLKGRTLSETHRQNIIAARTGRPMSPETRARISAAKRARRAA